MRANDDSTNAAILTRIIQRRWSKVTARLTSSTATRTRQGALDCQMGCRETTWPSREDVIGANVGRDSGVGRARVLRILLLPKSFHDLVQRRLGRPHALQRQAGERLVDDVQSWVRKSSRSGSM